MLPSCRTRQRHGPLPYITLRRTHDAHTHALALQKGLRCTCDRYGAVLKICAPIPVPVRRTFLGGACDDPYRDLNGPETPGWNDRNSILSGPRYCCVERLLSKDGTYDECGGPSAVMFWATIIFGGAAMVAPPAGRMSSPIPMSEKIRRAISWTSRRSDEICGH